MYFSFLTTWFSTYAFLLEAICDHPENFEAGFKGCPCTFASSRVA